jgi:hypothetical protein
MTFKSDKSTTASTNSKKNNRSNRSNNSNTSKYSYGTKSNDSQNSKDLNESINSSLEETKDNINRSIEESRNQIPLYNNIVNSYQEQSLQTAKEISEQYIESQKAVINSLQSAWRPYSESYNSFVTSIASPDSMTKAYTKFVSSSADNAVSAIRETNNIIFSNLNSMKSTLQLARDNAKQLSNLNVNAARGFENNSKQIASAVSESTNSNNQWNQGNSNESSADKTSYSTTKTSTTKKQ